MDVLVVEYHPIVRLGLTQLIRAHWPNARIRESGTLADGRSAIKADTPDLVTLDLSLPDAPGTEALTQLQRVAPGVPILILSQGAEVTHAQRVMQMGAAGYVEKSCTADVLVEAIRRVLAGGRYVSPGLADHLLALLNGNASQRLPHETLTSQEYRVMQLIALGFGASRIAETMRLSVKTVANYRANLLMKTALQNNIGIAKYCLEHGLTPRF